MGQQPLPHPTALSLRVSVVGCVSAARCPPFLHTWACMYGHWGMCSDRRQGHARGNRISEPRSFSKRAVFAGDASVPICRGFVASAALSSLHGPALFPTDLPSYRPTLPLAFPPLPWPPLSPVLSPFLFIFSTACFPYLFTLTPVLLYLSLHTCSSTPIPPNLCSPPPTTSVLSHICPPTHLVPCLSHSCPLTPFPRLSPFHLPLVLSKFLQYLLHHQPGWE